jgi:hypothetical protein
VGGGGAGRSGELALMLRGVPGVRALDAAQVDDLLAAFG